MNKARNSPFLNIAMQQSKPIQQRNIIKHKMNLFFAIFRNEVSVCTMKKFITSRTKFISCKNRSIPDISRTSEPSSS